MKRKNIPQGWTKNDEAEYQQYLNTWHSLQTTPPKRPTKPNKRYTPPRNT